MRQMFFGLLCFLVGLLAPLWLDRAMSGAPDWAWRLAAWLTVSLGVAIALLSDPVYTRLHGPNFSPLLSTLAVSIAFALVGGAAWWFYAIAGSQREEILIRSSATQAAVPAEPVIDLAIGEPFGNSTMITLKNSGIEPVESIAVNLRCFWLRTPDDEKPLLLFDGFESLENANAWWTIPMLEPNSSPAKKDAADAASRYLYNKKTFNNEAFMANAIVAVDVTYERRSDRKRFSFSGVADLFEDSQSGKPFMHPREMTDFIGHLLQTVTAPSYRVGDTPKP